MPRPKQPKRVCCNHEGKLFGSKNSHTENVLPLTSDAYEAFRLIDYEGLTQLEASKKMATARTTVQALYQTARKTLAKAMFENTMIQIIGGNHIVNENHSCCHEHTTIKRVAVMLKDNQITPQYHQANQLLMYTIEDDEITRKDRITPEGDDTSGCRKFMLSLGINHIITGNMFEHVYKKFTESNLEVYYAEKDPEKAINKFLDASLEPINNYLISSEGKDCHGNHKSQPCCNEG